MPGVGDVIFAYSDWGTWSPTTTGLTVGLGTLTARYRRIGKTVDFYLRFVYGVGSAVGTDPTFTAPATIASHISNYDFPGHARLLDTGNAVRPGFLRNTSTTVVQIYAWSTTNGQESITSTVPWTWGTSDTITCWGTYEAA